MASSVLGTNAVAPHSASTEFGTASTSEEVRTILAAGHTEAIAAATAYPSRPGRLMSSSTPSGLMPATAPKGLLAVRRQIHDLEAAQLKQLTYPVSEMWTVVDNQNPHRHPHTLVRATFANHGANPTVLEALVLRKLICFGGLS